MFLKVFKYVNKKFLLIIILVILLICMMMYVYNKYFNKQSTYVANREFVKEKPSTIPPTPSPKVPISPPSPPDPSSAPGPPPQPSSPSSPSSPSGINCPSGPSGPPDIPKKYAYFKLFCVNWCPYCNKLLNSGVYEKFYNENFKKEINGYTLLISKIDCTDDTSISVQKAISDYNITGFPTIKLEKDGENNPSSAIDFDAEPTLYNLNNFVQTAI
jgi:thiol-disulfide isomerase/thioredoxin